MHNLFKSRKILKIIKKGCSISQTIIEIKINMRVLCYTYQVGKYYKMSNIINIRKSLWQSEISYPASH